ncbi:glycosyltransferase [Tenacibaculum sp. 47A_GOM-205m]|uniref:glycosyltransferase n=1 Tax=Tenacibaculum sp. 47A_GOM-205m TaxID=1380384 RepID=UPI0004B050B8|nr:glycosyltransferase [Tenacibaculum sp. 47A_GOM-205m]
MKKIVFVIESLHLGGAEKSLVTLLNNIDYRKYKVDLILFKQGGVFFKEVPNEVNLIQKSFPVLSFFDRFLFKVKKLTNREKYHNAQLLWDLIRDKFDFYEKEYDIAVAYNQGFSTYYVNKFIKAKIKYAWLNTDYKKAGYNIEFDLPIYNEYEAIVAVSPEAKKGIEEALLGMNSTLNIKVIKDISDQEIILKKSKEELDFKFDKKRINIVTVARLAKQKGLHLAVESCKRLIDQGYKVHWYIVGEGSERKKIEALIKKHQLKDTFFLVGETHNPYPYIEKCDIYVQTSLFEGLGLTVIEATILKKPIICTNFPTAASIIENEETGLICDMNTESIVSSIKNLINRKDLQDKLVYNLSIKMNQEKEKTLKKIEEIFS